MTRPIITVSSVTYAMKAKEILRRNGIPSYIIKKARGPGNPSCAYALQVAEGVENAYRILEESKVVKLLGMSYEEETP